jgi:hypothetical protein
MLQCGHEMFLLINEIRFETTKLYQKRRNLKKTRFCCRVTTYCTYFKAGREKVLVLNVITSFWILEIWEEACVFLAVDFQLRPPFPPSHNRATMATPFSLYLSLFISAKQVNFTRQQVCGGGVEQTSGVFLKYTCCLGIENEGTVVSRRLPHILSVEESKHNLAFVYTLEPRLNEKAAQKAWLYLRRCQQQQDRENQLES